MEKKLFLALLISMLGVQNGWAMELESKIDDSAHQLQAMVQQCVETLLISTALDLDVVQELAAVGIQPDSLLGPQSMSPLHVAVTINNSRAILALVAAGANVNQTTSAGNFCSTPLHTAASTGASDAAKALLESRADTTLRNSYGVKALDLALITLNTNPKITPEEISGLKKTIYLLDIRG